MPSQRSSMAMSSVLDEDSLSWANSCSQGSDHLSTHLLRDHPSAGCFSQSADVPATAGHLLLLAPPCATPSRRTACSRQQRNSHNFSALEEAVQVERIVSVPAMNGLSLSS
jgi:hypothetical protein